jgi:hypothetical protein
MALGRKTGGRQQGTPNKRTQEVSERLAELGCDPIEGMALIAMDESNSPELRGRMFAELAAYVAAKRRAVEVTSPVEAEPTKEVILLAEALSPGELLDLHQKLEAFAARKALAGAVDEAGEPVPPMLVIASPTSQRQQ